jgi:hypothetical protein
MLIFDLALVAFLVLPALAGCFIHSMGEAGR